MNHMFYEKNKKVLKFLVAALEDVDWVIIGSTALALQGVPVDSQDIDILTNREGANKINALLIKFAISPVVYTKSDAFQSYFGKFHIGNVEIEVMGDLKYFVRNEWISFSHILYSHDRLKIDDIEVPVEKLDDLIEGYKVLGRSKDLEKIQKIRQCRDR